VNDYPSVGVVVPTRGSRRELRDAVAAVLAQDYPGELRLAVVVDGHETSHQCERERGLGLASDERLKVMANARTPGLAGARNTGVLALETDLVAFCDDDDQWLPGKLRAQVDALRLRPQAEMASCGIVVEYRGQSKPRLVGRDAVSYDDLLRSRMVMVHSSTYLLWRDALVERIGLADETIPHGQSEDWDLALRAARRTHIVFVDRPLVRVHWGESSYFAAQWETRAEGLLWMLRRHPDLARSHVGAARVYGQLAFSYACLGRRRDAWLWTRRALRRNWHERRVPVALAVAAGLVSGDTVLRGLHSLGHGV
jgi:glycosyltransferase involved in cell wall biosynthesis